jgi:hypothetical protein
MVVIVGGRTGTLGDLAIAHDEGRLIGVLKGSGGITDLVEEIIRVSGQTGARVVYDDNPARLVQRLLITYETEHFRKASCFYDSRAETA